MSQGAQAGPCHSHCSQGRPGVRSAVPGCQGSRAEPLWPAADSEIQHTSISIHGWWQLCWPQRSTWTLPEWTQRRKTSPWLSHSASFVLPHVVLLLNQNLHQSVQVTGDFSQSLTARPSILRLQFLSPPVSICTKTTTRFKLQQLMKFNYINREKAFFNNNFGFSVKKMQ